MPTGSEPLSMVVVKAVADAERVDPLDLPSPLGDAVDPDALDVLFQNGSGHLSFDYCGNMVTVDAEGSVDVTPLNEV
ncbi:HalOD1 output domain-containing protein [Haloferax sp. KTX1]|uniref:HalOD1 output domain-containing protein n=1 Tax=Haloferax sp. KTX1 TaxID=2600597 RepID=UPI0011DD0713|nr:HalOD1 output domain-containing protein [Haloferax sp. KTX1]